MRQKRPVYAAKEACLCGKRDLHLKAQVSVLVLFIVSVCMKCGYVSWLEGEERHGGMKVRSREERRGLMRGREARKREQDMKTRAHEQTHANANAFACVATRIYVHTGIRVHIHMHRHACTYVHIRIWYE